MDRKRFILGNTLLKESSFMSDTVTRHYVLETIRNVYTKTPNGSAGGFLHIQIDDGNMEDANFSKDTLDEYLEAECPSLYKSHSGEIEDHERICYIALKKLDYAERRSVWAEFHGSPESEVLND